MIIFNGFQPLTIITTWSILDVAAVLDPPLNTKSCFTVDESNLCYNFAKLTPKYFEEDCSFTRSSSFIHKLGNIILYIPA